MSNRIKGYTVILDKDYKDESAEIIENAIRMIKGVKDVKPSIVNSDDLMNRMKIQSEMKMKLYDLIDEINKEE